jgi:hypothetical protein
MSGDALESFRAAEATLDGGRQQYITTAQAV